MSNPAGKDLPQPRRRRTDGVQADCIQVSQVAFRDYSTAWILLRQLTITLDGGEAAKHLTQYQKELLHASGHLSSVPGHRKKEKTDEEKARSTDVHSRAD